MTRIGNYRPSKFAALQLIAPDTSVNAAARCLTCWDYRNGVWKHRGTYDYDRNWCRYVLRCTHDCHGEDGYHVVAPASTAVALLTPEPDHYGEVVVDSLHDDRRPEEQRA